MKYLVWDPLVSYLRSLLRSFYRPILLLLLTLVGSAQLIVATFHPKPFISTKRFRACNNGLSTSRHTYNLFAGGPVSSPIIDLVEYRPTFVMSSGGLLLSAIHLISPDPRQSIIFNPNVCLVTGWVTLLHYEYNPWECLLPPDSYESSSLSLIIAAE